MSHDTVRKVEQIVANAMPEVLAKVRSGEQSINAAVKTVTSPKPAKLVEQPMPKTSVSPAFVTLEQY